MDRIQTFKALLICGHLYLEMLKNFSNGEELNIFRIIKDDKYVWKSNLKFYSFDEELDSNDTAIENGFKEVLALLKTVIFRNRRIVGVSPAIPFMVWNGDNEQRDIYR